MKPQRLGGRTYEEAAGLRECDIPSVDNTSIDREARYMSTARAPNHTSDTNETQQVTGRKYEKAVCPKSEKLEPSECARKGESSSAPKGSAKRGAVRDEFATWTETAAERERTTVLAAPPTTSDEVAAWWRQREQVDGSAAETALMGPSKPAYSSSATVSGEHRRKRAEPVTGRRHYQQTRAELAQDETVEEPDLPDEVYEENIVTTENGRDFTTELEAVQSDEPSRESAGLGENETASRDSPSDINAEEQEQGIPVAHIVNTQQVIDGEGTNHTQDAVAAVMQDEVARRRVLGDTVVVAVEDNLEPPKPTHLTRFRMVLIVIVILALVGGAVGIAIAATRGDGTSPAGAAQSGGPTQPPTSAEFVKFTPVVADAAPSTSDALEQPGSPQRRALMWLVDEDEFVFDQSDTEKFVQRFTLATLYYATGGMNWKQNYNFLTDADECDWGENVSNVEDQFRGVRCSGEDRVKYLVLKNNNLDGTIPDEMHTLINLTILDLGTNSLTGNIRPWIGNLTKLREIYLQENDLHGHLPATLGNLISVTDLNLGDNMLSGFIPTSLGHMTSLRNLWLGMNDIKGTDENPDAGVDIFCGLGLDKFWADCLGSNFPPVPADVVCGCCTICCNKGGDCLAPSP